MTKTSELEDVLFTIVGAMEQQKKATAAATLPPHTSNKSDIKKLFTIFLAGQKPPESSNKPSTSTIERKLQEVLDGIKNNKGNVPRSRKPREPNPKFIFYWTLMVTTKPITVTRAKTRRNFMTIMQHLPIQIRNLALCQTRMCTWDQDRASEKVEG